MDSFVLAETFKYLYLLFSEEKDVVINMDDFVFTTEAHILPLTLSVGNYSWRGPNKVSHLTPGMSGFIPFEANLIHFEPKSMDGCTTAGCSQHAGFL